MEEGFFNQSVLPCPLSASFSDSYLLLQDENTLTDSAWIFLGSLDEIRRCSNPSVLLLFLFKRIFGDYKNYLIYISEY